MTRTVVGGESSSGATALVLFESTDSADLDMIISCDGSFDGVVAVQSGDLTISGLLA